MKQTALFLALLFCAVTVSAQGVRDTANANGTTQTARQPAAPNSFAAQYQGGMFGYSKKIKGTLAYDDANKRFVFRDKDNKEILGFPYKSLNVVYGSSQSYRPTAATVASAVPSIYAIPFGFIRGKNRFLVVEFNDPDSNVKGTTSFKVANKALLESVVQTLGDKAELKQRGDAFYRPREEAKPVI